MSTLKAWHWLPNDRRLAHAHNGERPVIAVGTTLKCDPERLRLCRYGLHASKRILDALKYAEGSIICRVQCSGRIVHGNDKFVASERTVLAMADATEVLHRFACWCAKRALDASGNADHRIYAAIEVKLKWLTGAATDQELSAARSAAWSAAASAERSAQNRKLTAMVQGLFLRNNG